MQQGLKTRAQSNKPVDTDAQVLPCATRTRRLCAGHVQR